MMIEVRGTVVARDIGVRRGCRRVGVGEERGTEQDVGETRRHFAPKSKIRRPDYLPNVA
jgi:hypothetical protein